MRTRAVIISLLIIGLIPVVIVAVLILFWQLDRSAAPEYITPVEDSGSNTEVVEAETNDGVFSDEESTQIQEEAEEPGKKTIVDFEGIESYRVEHGNFIYYIDTSVYSSEADMDRYIDRLTEGNQNSYEFVTEYLGFKSNYQENLMVIRLAESRGTYQTQNRIVSSYQESFDTSPGGTSGNAHELTHLLFQGLYPIGGTTAWEEGLADYMEHYERYGADYSRWGFTCSDQGWSTGGEFVEYSDFSKPGDPSAEFYSPRSGSSHYRSAECFWIHIREQYGEEKMKEIIRYWNVAQSSSSSLKFIRDIVGSVLGVDLSDFVYSRYNFTE